VSAAILLATEVEPDTGADADKAATDDEGVKEVKERLGSVEWRVEGRGCVKRDGKMEGERQTNTYIENGTETVHCTEVIVRCTQYNSHPSISCSFFSEGATHCMTTHVLPLGMLAAMMALEDLVPLWAELEVN
jgi:hypothetical protein